MQKRQVVLCDDFIMWKTFIFFDKRRQQEKKDMKKVIIGIAVAAILGLLIVFYVFRQETVSVGKYQVLCYKNRGDVDPRSLPQDMNSLKQIPGLIRITWQEQIEPNMFQEYCYLPGRGTEKSRVIRTK